MWDDGPRMGLPFVAEYLSMDAKFSRQCNTKGLMVSDPNSGDSHGIDFSDAEAIWQLRT